MLWAVPAVAVSELAVVALELQSRRHLLVGQRPVAPAHVQVRRATLQEHADGLLGGLADQRRVDMPAANIGEAANVTEHLAERVRPLPRHCERADSAGAHAAYAPPCCIGAKVVLGGYFRNYLFQQEAGVSPAERIVFDAALAAVVAGRWRSAWNIAGIDEDTDHHGDFLFVDKVVHDDGRSYLAADVTATILEDHHAGWLGGIVLGRNVHPVCAHRTGEYLARGGVGRDFTLRHARLNLRVRTKFVCFRLKSFFTITVAAHYLLLFMNRGFFRFIRRIVSAGQKQTRQYCHTHNCNKGSHWLNPFRIRARSPG